MFICLVNKYFSDGQVDIYISIEYATKLLFTSTNISLKVIKNVTGGPSMFIKSLTYKRAHMLNTQKEHMCFTHVLKRNYVKLVFYKTCICLT